MHRLVQQNSGMRMYVMPGARNLKIVQAMLIPDRVEPIDPKVTAQIQ